jgi:hypothetical protein
MLASIFVLQRVADPVRVGQQRARDELGDGCGDLLWQLGDLALRAGTNLEFPVASGTGHAAPVLRNR